MHVVLFYFFNNYISENYMYMKCNILSSYNYAKFEVVGKQGSVSGRRENC